MTTMTKSSVTAAIFLAQMRASEGGADTAERVLVDLREAGVSVRVEAESLRVVGQLTPELRERVKAMKPLIVAALTQDRRPAPLPWDSVEADHLIDLAKMRFEHYIRERERNYPAMQGEEERAERWSIYDRIDLAYASQDFAGLREAVMRLVANLDGFPKFQAGVVWFEEALTCVPLWTAWIRWRKEWYPLIRDAVDRTNLGSMLSDCTQAYPHCDTIILPNGEHPNKKAATL